MWPLPALYVSANEANHAAIEAFGSIIASELNMVEIKELENTDSLESNFLTVNFKVAGRVLKNRANDVKAYLAGLGAAEQQALSDAVKAGKAISVLDIADIEPDVFTVNAKSADNVAIYKNNDEFVAIDTTISEELQRAGILRDIVRQCQVFRKEAGFDVSDKIFIGFATDSELMNSIIAEKEAQLTHDLLATVEAPAEPEFTGVIDLDGAKITVTLKRK